MIHENAGFPTSPSQKPEEIQKGTLIEFGHGDVSVGTSGPYEDGYVCVHFTNIIPHQIGSRVDDKMAVLAFHSEAGIDTVIKQLNEAKKRLQDRQQKNS